MYVILPYNTVEAWQECDRKERQVMAVLPHQSGKKDHRLELRVDPQIKAVIRDAARFRGQSISSFAVSILAEKAQEVVDLHTSTRLSVRDYQTINALLTSEAEPNERLSKAAAKFKKRATQTR